MATRWRSADTALWRRDGIQVHPKPGARLMRTMGRQGQRPARHPRTTCRQHVYPRDRHWVHGLTVGRPDHVWGAEITSRRLPETFVSRAVVLEV